MNIYKEALLLHKKNKGKISVLSKVKIRNARDLSLAYSPGVAEPCREIAKDKSKIYTYTSKSNMVAVVSDGSAVLGLGNIGPFAALPVMEGKAILFKKFAGIDAFPICLNTQDKDEIVNTVKLLEPVFGGINLEDISGPKCFYIEERLKKEMNIPVFHDDQHGTAVVVLAGLLNALKFVGKKLEKIKIVINGAGAAGIAIAKISNKLKVKEIILCDTHGIIYADRKEGMNFAKEQASKYTNPRKIKGKLQDALTNADVFIGVSAANVLKKEDVKQMNNDSIIFALANPDPEITPDDARSSGAAIVATGRSDYPNQVNNVLGFPGIFRGALDVRASEINEEMKISAIYAIANLIPAKKIRNDYIIPSPFDKRVVKAVSLAVAKAAVKSGVARNGAEGSRRL
ncbi:MAG: malic enzyme-like NAD(P)-binding protein [Candidatus Firestonebacteria bacterium]